MPNRVVEKKSRSLWRGPYEDGITQSLLNLFLMCRERFRLRAIEGLAEAERFSKPLEFGNMWHLCEEHHAAGEDYVNPLRKYVMVLCSQHRMEQKEVAKFGEACERMFPVYIKHWSKHKESKNCKPIAQEVVFTVPYTLPSGRVVKLKGKYDRVDRETIKREQYNVLQENKTKGDIRQGKIQRQLFFDLQTMTYAVALQHDEEVGEGLPIKSVRYNVVKRPFSGGKGSITQKKATRNKPAETSEAFWGRFIRDYVAKTPDEWFMRWTSVLTQQDIHKFEHRFLQPVLEQVCDWWDAMVAWNFSPWDRDNIRNMYHWRTPYGIHNVIAEGGSSDLDEYLDNGSKIGLRKIETLFPELENA